MMPHSYVDAAGVPSQQVFPFSFGYVSRDHIYVYLEGVQTDAWAFVNDTSIALNAPLEVPTIVRIRRIER